MVRYDKFLYDYECHQHGFSTRAELQTAVEANKREGRRNPTGGGSRGGSTPTGGGGGGGIGNGNGINRGGRAASDDQQVIFCDF
jgi:hypothetical protein